MANIKEINSGAPRAALRAASGQSPIAKEMWKKRKKKQQQSRVFFGVIFYVYTNVDNKERARASYWDEFRRKKNMEIQSGGEKMRNARGQQGENERQWKIKAYMNTGNKILGKPKRYCSSKNKDKLRTSRAYVKTI